MNCLIFPSERVSHMPEHFFENILYLKLGGRVPLVCPDWKQLSCIPRKYLP